MGSGITIDYDLERYPLYLKTDSSLSNNIIYLKLFPEKGSLITDISLNWDKKKYRLGSCTPGKPDPWLDLLNVPTDTVKTWIITKTSTSLTITCNDVEVVKLVYDDVDKNTFPDCISKMGISVKRILFYDILKYRQAPGKYLISYINIEIILHVPRHESTKIGKMAQKLFLGEILGWIPACTCSIFYNQYHDNVHFRVL